MALAGLVLGRFYAVPRFSIERVELNSESSTPEGVQQPFADWLRVSFEVPELDRAHSFVLHAMHELFSPNASVEYHHEDGSISTGRHSLVTYVSRDPEHRIVLTLDDETIGSLSYHANAIEESFYLTPLAHLADVHEFHPSKVESLKTVGNKTDRIVFHFMDDLPQSSDGSPEAVASQSLRNLLQRFPSVNERWVGCHGADAKTEFAFRLGVFTDAAYVKRTKVSPGDPSKAFQSVIARANQVFRPQLGIFMQIAETVIKSAKDSNLWNQDTVSPTPCAPTPEEQLDSFTQMIHQTRQSSNVALYHLFTGCRSYNPGDVIGLAYLSRLCSRFHNTGWTTYGPDQWTSFTHEIGHNIGARHTFQTGLGTTGGIMDYGDGTLSGVYQFNKQYSQKELCDGIRRARGLLQGNAMKPANTCINAAK